MTKIALLEALKEFTEGATKELVMPVKPQKNDPRPEPRAAEVYLMRLPSAKDAKELVPYIIHQVITGKDSQAKGEPEYSTAVIRSIFCIYNPNEGEGGLMLLNLMERLRIEMERQVIIGRQFQLNLEAGLEMLIYPDDSAPYYIGEMVTTWLLPAVKREVNYG